MKKALCVLCTFGLLLATLSGCGSKSDYSATFSDASIDTIRITVDGYPVKIETTSGNDITVSVAKVEGTVATQNGNLLEIELPEPSGGVSFSSAPELVVSLPDRVYASISITGGSIEELTVGSLDVQSINISIQYGDIALTGLEGRITANTSMGVIKSSLNDIAVDIQNEDSMGGVLSGQIGADNEKEIAIQTAYGDMTIE